MKKINIIQFTPYYPPHIGWLEKVSQEIHQNWNYWDSVVVTGNVWIESVKLWKNILVYPACNLVYNFPIPKFWKREFWVVMKKLRKHCSNNTRLLSHTRFFLSSFIGWIFAKKNNLKWIHLEHGSGFVLSWNTIVDFFSKIYDQSLWRYCFKKADIILGISNVSKNFVKKNFWRTNTQTWYRGIDFEKWIWEKKWEIVFLYIWRLTALKRVSDFIQAYKEWWFSQKWYIIWEGDFRTKLEKQAEWLNIEFLWYKSHHEIMRFLNTHHCILLNPSSQEGLPTTVIEWLLTKNIVIASNVWGTSEISQELDLILYQPWDIPSLVKTLEETLKNFQFLEWKSYASVKQKFSMEENLEKLYNFIK